MTRETTLADDVRALVALEREATPGPWKRDAATWPNREALIEEMAIALRRGGLEHHVVYAGKDNEGLWLYPAMTGNGPPGESGASSPSADAG